MQSKFLVTSASVFIALIVGGCGSTTPPGVATVASPSAAASGETIKVATDAKLGQILVDEEGKTVYLFLRDTGTGSTCYTDCAKFWPPVLTTGAPVAESGAQASLLGTTKRTDGTTEVTYAGHPLYYFLNDKKAGDTTGQGVNGFGALWWVVSPAGVAITTK
jgi:predicted lipoprotein with Yx(FWY)xxD motif